MTNLEEIKAALDAADATAYTAENACEAALDAADDASDAAYDSRDAAWDAFFAELKKENSK